MFRTIAVAAALMLTTVTMVSAQGQGDARERAACRPDVMRFCKQLIEPRTLGPATGQHRPHLHV